MGALKTLGRLCEVIVPQCEISRVHPWEDGWASSIGHSEEVSLGSWLRQISSSRMLDEGIWRAVSGGAGEAEWAGRWHLQMPVSSPLKLFRNIGVNHELLPGHLALPRDYYASAKSFLSRIYSVQL